MENNQKTLFESDTQQNLSQVVDQLITSYESLKEENMRLQQDLEAIKNESVSYSSKTQEELDKLETIVLEQEQEKDDIFAKISKVLGE